MESLLNGRGSTLFPSFRRRYCLAVPLSTPPLITSSRWHFPARLHAPVPTHMRSSYWSGRRPVPSAWLWSCLRSRLLVQIKHPCSRLRALGSVLLAPCSWLRALGSVLSALCSFWQLPLQRLALCPFFFSFLFFFFFFFFFNSSSHTTMQAQCVETLSSHFVRLLVHRNLAFPFTRSLFLSENLSTKTLSAERAPNLHHLL
jgi:hypothetical protein